MRTEYCYLVIPGPGVESAPEEVLRGRMQCVRFCPWLDRGLARRPRCNVYPRLPLRITGGEDSSGSVCRHDGGCIHACPYSIYPHTSPESPSYTSLPSPTCISRYIPRSEGDARNALCLEFIIYSATVTTTLRPSRLNFLPLHAPWHAARAMSPRRK